MSRILNLQAIEDETPDQVSGEEENSSWSLFYCSSESSNCGGPPKG